MSLPVPTGPAKLFFVAGLLVFLAGGAIFAFAVVTTLATFFRDFDSYGPGNEPDFSRIGELLPAAFALIIPGAIVAVTAAAIGARAASGSTYHYGDRFDGVTTIARDNARLTMGDVHYQTRNIRIAIGELYQIEDTVSALRIPWKARETIQHYLQDAEQELEQDEPDMSMVEERLVRATQVMKKVGAFVGAGQELIPKLKTVATLLGLSGLGGLL